MRNKISLTHQVKTILDSKLAIGDSKHKDKEAGRAKGDVRSVTKEKIYSWSTYRSYLKHAIYFVNDCKKRYGCKTVESCRCYVDSWLKSRFNLSPYTLALEKSALAKLYGCSTTDFVKTAPRLRSGITRSRGKKVRDKHFSEARNADFVAFCKSTGLRRRELELLTGDKLVYQNSTPYILVDRGSKGGRRRYSPIIGDIDKIVRMMKKAGKGKVFEKVPTGADIHSYRADYATAIYKKYARPIKDIPCDYINKQTGKHYQSEVYHCRGDRKGVKLDKRAMLMASRALGHNRISVVGEHYLR